MTARLITLTPESGIDFPRPVPAFSKFPSKWEDHERVLLRFAEIAWSRKWETILPVFDDKSKWDFGVDLIVNGEALDFKVVRLSPYNPNWKTRTIISPSPIYQGYSPSPDALTDWFIFAPSPDAPLHTWEAARYRGLTPSLKGENSFFYNKDVISLSELSEILESNS